jgi:hypothetical protein
MTGRPADGVASGPVPWRNPLQAVLAELSLRRRRDHFIAFGVAADFQPLSLTIQNN